MLRIRFAWLLIVVLVLLLIETIDAQPTDPIPVECGSSVDGSFIEYGEQEQMYFIELTEGDSLHLAAHVRGESPDIRLMIGAWSPSGENLNSRPNWHTGEFHEHPTKTMEIEPVTQAGIYEMIVLGSDLGAYTFEVGCTLADGTVIEPGSDLLAETPSADFSGFGFVGFDPVDFADIPAISVEVGQLYTNAIASTAEQPTIYTYDAQAGELVKLSMNRASGDLSLGMAIVSVTDNALLFFTGMPSASGLSTQVTFPADGLYAIGIFRLDVPPQLVGTSGTYEFQLRR